MEEVVCPKDFVNIIEHPKETYIAHVKLTEGEAITLILTNLRVYCLNAAKTVLWTLPFLSIYSIETTAASETPEQPVDEQQNRFYINYTNPKKSVKSPLVCHSFSTATSIQKDLWVIVIRRLLRDAWQEYFEENWVKEPEIYQIHRLCLRYSLKGKRTPTCILLSTYKIYEFSLQKQLITPRELKFSAPISNVKLICDYKNVDTLMTVVIMSEENEEETFTLRFYYKDDKKWL